MSEKETPTHEVLTVDLRQIKNADQLPRRRSIIHEFFLHTSAHGLPGIARSKTVQNRIFWSLSFLIFLGIMIFFVSSAIITYFNYPTNVNLDIIGEWPQNFPAVSVCNLSPVRLDKIVQPVFNYAVSMNYTSPNATAASVLTFSNLSGYIRNLLNNNKSFADLLFQLDSMLFYCQYNSFNCSSQDFTEFVSSSYGNCFTFNAKLKNAPNGGIRSATEYGGDGILELAFYIYANQYIPDLYGGSGIVLLIHDNDELPIIEKASFELGPALKHKLSFRKTTNYFLKSPYTTCTTKISPMMQAMFTNYNSTDYAYSEAACYQLCGQIYVYDQCGCVDPWFWSGRVIPKPGTNDLFYAPICSFEDNCVSEAKSKLWSSNDLRNEYCQDCEPQCETTNFIVRTSALAAPSDWQLASIKAFAENSSIPLPQNWSTTWTDEIYKNYVAVRVVRESNIVENTTQTPTMGFVDVLSSIGGQSGLWIGASFLSIIELIEMFYRLICVEIRSLHRRLF